MKTAIKKKTDKQIQNLNTKNELFEVFYLEEIGSDRRVLKSKEHRMFMEQIEHNRKMIAALIRRRNGEKVEYPVPELAQ